MLLLEPVRLAVITGRYFRNAAETSIFCSGVITIRSGNTV
jgi:hypothetical protein